MPIVLKRRRVEAIESKSVEQRADEQQELERRFNDLEGDAYASTIVGADSETDVDASSKLAAAKAKPTTPKRAPKAKSVAVVKSAPPSRFTDATMRCVFAEASLMTRVLARMGTIGPNLVLDFAPSSSPDGLSMTLMHTSEVLMARLHVPMSAFLVYSVERSTSYSLHFEQVRGLTKASAADHTLTFVETPRRRDKFCVRMHSARVDRMRVLDVRDPSTIVAAPNVEYTSWPYPVAVTMSARAFHEEIVVCRESKVDHITLDIGRVGEHDGDASARDDDDDEASAVTAEYDGLVFTSSSESSRLSETIESIVRVSSIERRRDDADKPLQVHRQQFAVDFAHIASTFQELATTVTLHFGFEDNPLWLRFVVPTGSNDSAATPGHVDILVAAKA